MVELSERPVMITNEFAGKKQMESTQHLKSIFEQSLAVLREDKNVIKKSRPNVRLRRDFLPLHTEPANLEKVALDEAAKALAVLWRVSGTGRSRLPGTVIRK
jgi:hypothetical protein